MKHRESCRHTKMLQGCESICWKWIISPWYYALPDQPEGMSQSTLRSWEFIQYFYDSCILVIKATSVFLVLFVFEHFALKRGHDDVNWVMELYSVNGVSSKMRLFRQRCTWFLRWKSPAHGSEATCVPFLALQYSIHITFTARLSLYCSD